MLPEWSNDIEEILENIRRNSVILSKVHKQQYLKLRHILLYFRLPIIVLSGINSVISVGLENYISQLYLSGIVCIISLFTGLIGSVELFLQIQQRTENELLMSKEYYILSIDIYKQLKLEREHRAVDGSSFLEEQFSIYTNLIEKSNPLKRRIDDQLTTIPLQPLEHNNSLIKLNSNSSDKEDSSDASV
jgi:hypothetical protein